MTHDTYNEIYKYYKAHIPVLKDVIKRNGKFRINVVNIGNYFGRVGEDPDLIYQAIKICILISLIKKRIRLKEI